MPVTASAVKPAKFQNTAESESDEELDSEDLDESDGYVLFSVLLLLSVSKSPFPIEPCPSCSYPLSALESRCHIEYMCRG